MRATGEEKTDRCETCGDAATQWDYDRRGSLPGLSVVMGVGNQGRDGNMRAWSLQ